MVVVLEMFLLLNDNHFNYEAEVIAEKNEFEQDAQSSVYNFLNNLVGDFKEEDDDNSKLEKIYNLYPKSGIFDTFFVNGNNRP